MFLGLIYNVINEHTYSISKAESYGSSGDKRSEE
jgi:hypothetical protein